MNEESEHCKETDHEKLKSNNPQLEDSVTLIPIQANQSENLFVLFARYLSSIILSLIFLLLALVFLFPILLLILCPLYLISQICHYFFQKFSSNQVLHGGFLNNTVSLSPVQLSSDELRWVNFPRPVINVPHTILLGLEGDSRLELDTLKDLIRRRVLELRDRHGRLVYPHFRQRIHRTSVMGIEHYEWRFVEDFCIDEHIISIQKSRSTPEDVLKYLAASHSNYSMLLPQSAASNKTFVDSGWRKPHWDIHVLWQESRGSLKNPDLSYSSRFFISNRSPSLIQLDDSVDSEARGDHITDHHGSIDTWLVVRVHPAICDGISLLHLFCSALSDNQAHLRLKKRFGARRYFLVNYIKMILIGPFIFIQKWFLSKFQDNPIHSKQIKVYKDDYCGEFVDNNDVQFGESTRSASFQMLKHKINSLMFPLRSANLSVSQKCQTYNNSGENITRSSVCHVAEEQNYSESQFFECSTPKSTPKNSLGSALVFSTTSKFELSHSEICGPSKKSFFAIKIDLNEMTRLKQITRSTFNDLFLSLIAGALRCYQQVGGISQPNDILSLIPVDASPQIARLRLRNNFTMVDFSLPVNTEGMLPRLWETRQRMEELKSSVDIQILSAINALSHRVLHSKANNFLKRFYSKSTCLISNIQGPEIFLNLDQKSVKTVAYWFASPKTVDLSFNFFTYNDHVCLAVSGNETICPHLEFLLYCFKKQVKNLSNLLENRRLPSLYRTKPTSKTSSGSRMKSDKAHSPAIKVSQPIEQISDNTNNSNIEIKVESVVPLIDDSHSPINTIDIDRDFIAGVGFVGKNDFLTENYSNRPFEMSGTSTPSHQIHYRIQSIQSLLQDTRQTLKESEVESLRHEYSRLMKELRRRKSIAYDPNQESGDFDEDLELINNFSGDSVSFYDNESNLHTNSSIVRLRHLRRRTSLPGFMSLGTSHFRRRSTIGNSLLGFGMNSSNIETRTNIKSGTSGSNFFISSGSRNFSAVNSVSNYSFNPSAFLMNSPIAENFRKQSISLHLNPIINISEEDMMSTPRSSSTHLSRPKSGLWLKSSPVDLQNNSQTSSAQFSDSGTSKQFDCV